MKYADDNFGRNTQIKQRLNNSPVWEQLGNYSYGALGLQKGKLLGWHQQIDYAYNERGWLTHINNPATRLSLGRDYFAMELCYDRAFDKVRLDGNITGVFWRSRQDRIARSYGFNYDGLSRLTGADYTRQMAQGVAWQALEEDNYSLHQVNYDDGGNILRLRQSGLQKRGKKASEHFCGEIDRLEYKYHPENYNQLTSIDDHVMSFGASNDFRDDAKGSWSTACSAAIPEEYEYDLSGNMIYDKNKGLTIAYNPLNLPNQVSFSHGGVETYTYSGEGLKLRTKYKHGPDTNHVRDYCNAWIYEDDVLKYTLHGDGRVLRDDATDEWSYEYHIKDHLGNIRVTFRQQPDMMYAGERHKATMEIVNEASEDTLFKHVSETRHLTNSYARTGAASARLNAAENRPLGPSRWFAVSAYDTVQLEAFAHYVSNGNANVFNWLSWLPLLSFSGGLNTGEGSNYQQVSPLLGFALAANIANFTFNSGVPKAYLRYAYFNSDSVYLSGGIQQISGAATSTWDSLSLAFLAPEDGYVQVWVANESATNVYFDDISVSVTNKYIVEELHYSPWGLELAGLTSSNSPYRYNGKEEEKRTSFFDYGARRYDKQVGRWWSVDPLAEKYPSFSPYVFCYNNPINVIDPDGREGIVVSGSPGGHKNRDHFLINGLDRAKAAQKHTQHKGEGVTWMVYNDKENGFTQKQLNIYKSKAAKAGVTMMVVSDVDDIVSYVNNKNGGDSRTNDKVTSFYYVGHSTPGDLDVGYRGTGEDFEPDNFNYDAFSSGCHVNLVGGCRTAVPGVFEDSNLTQFSKILDSKSKVYGSDVKVDYWKAGVMKDTELLKTNKGKIVEKKGELPAKTEKL